MSDERIASMITGLQQAGLTNTEISREAGLSRHTLWRHQVGDVRQPLLETYDRLAALCQRRGLPIPQQPGRNRR